MEEVQMQIGEMQMFYLRRVEHHTVYHLRNVENVKDFSKKCVTFLRFL